jgi:hypothetical protein
MNSVIEAQQTFLEFCPVNWKSDKFIRMINYTTDSHVVNGHYRAGKRCLDIEKNIDETYAVWNAKDRAERELRLLDEQRIGTPSTHKIITQNELPLYSSPKGLEVRKPKRFYYL